MTASEIGYIQRNWIEEGKHANKVQSPQKIPPTGPIGGLMALPEAELERMIEQMGGYPA